MSLSVCSTSRDTSPTNLEQSLVFTWLHGVTLFPPQDCCKVLAKNIYINRFKLHQEQVGKGGQMQVEGK